MSERRLSGSGTQSSNPPSSSEEMLWGRRQGNGTMVAAYKTDGAPDAPAERLEQVPRRFRKRNCGGARSAVGASRPLPCWGGQHQLSQTAVVCNDNQEEPSGDDYQDRVG